MNPSCAKCNKVVYPVEKFNCLDKIWHKGCFSCDTCGLKLTMKTYKGYQKKPYCSTHYPTLKFTAVDDTPESRRLKNATENNSHLAYTKDYRKKLAEFTSVSETPESNRLKATSHLQSQANYRKDYNENIGQNPYLPDSSETKQKTHLDSSSNVPHSGQLKIIYSALYDYNATEDDEVGFIEGDIIIDTEQIDEGWMIGTNQRTQKRGLLPSNYVEKS